MTSPSTGFQNGVLNARIEQPGAHRLGLKLAAGVLSVVGANGVDLSNINLGYVTMPNTTNRSQLNTYAINANQSFSDSSSGGSTIIGNTFGTTAATAWAQDVPFYLYACIDDSNSAPVFGISRVPNMVVSPGTANIGTPASATADVQYGLFLFSSVTIANYDANPVVFLGAFRMRKNSSDDWAVQTLTASDGFGRTLEDLVFTMPTGVQGASANSYFQPNGGTAPIFGSANYTYTLSKSGLIFLNLTGAMSGGTSGAGAVTLQCSIPLDGSNQIGQMIHPGFGNFQNTGGNPFLPHGPSINGTYALFYLNNNTANVQQNASFPNTAGYNFRFNCTYPIRSF